MVNVSSLPQLSGGLFLSDGGLETTLVFLDRVDLPHFAAFPLLDNADGRERLRRYYEPYLELCTATPGARFVLETPTWRANTDWGQRPGYGAAALHRANVDAARWIVALREAWRERIAGPIVASGVIGPRGDGYVADVPTSVADVAGYQVRQAAALKEGGVDMLAAVTMTTTAEATGVARPARSVGLPAVISFTIETDGRLPSGESLRDAMAQVEADAPPAYYALNCAHPTYFEQMLATLGALAGRIHAIRANASVQSHAELDNATELDLGDPSDLGDRYRRLRAPLPALNVLGGCCGTDARHLRAIRDAWLR
jgi:homocysteine S-methyltransferase